MSYLKILTKIEYGKTGFWKAVSTLGVDFVKSRYLGEISPLWLAGCDI